MVLKVLNFGCNWWGRFGHDAADPLRYTRHAVYYNSTGVRCGRKVRRHWLVPGLIRFNGVSGFNPHFPIRLLGCTFLASDPEFLLGGNRLLMKQKLPNSVPPECFLVVVSQALHGQVDLGSTAWKSSATQVIAASQLRQNQEILLLMKPGDWVRTTCGIWQLSVPDSCKFGAGLSQLDGQVDA
jgi:hypothetical protein